MARPKAGEGKKLSKVILFRVNEEEMNQLETASQTCGQAVGQLVRAKVFRGKFPQPVMPKTDQQTVIELNKIGVNLNQLTRKANSGILPIGLLPLLMKLMQLLELILAKLFIHDRQSKDR